MNIIRHEYDFAGHPLTLEIGKLAHLSDAAITLYYKDTVMLVTVNMSKEAAAADFFPMMVDYREKYYAAGKIRINRFTKREARPSDEDVLLMRIIDRSLRPLFPKGMRNDVQIVASVLSYDPETDPSLLGMLGASTALHIAGAPIDESIASVRVGMKDGQLTLGETPRDLEENADLNLMLAGSSDAVTMIESDAHEVGEEKFIEAIEFGHAEIQKLVAFQKEFIEKVGRKEFTPALAEENEENTTKIKAAISDADADAAILHKDKHEFANAVKALETSLEEKFATEIEEGTMTIGEMKGVVNKVLGNRIRQQVLENNRRIDGRNPEEIRDLKVELDLLPRAHGSALFGRGITESLSVVTLGAMGEGSYVGAMEEEYQKRYVHHYNFFPYAVGEARPIRFTSRREVGHGFLGERALKNVLPSEEDFPYFMRVVSEITSCNGSSSMAAICGSTASLMAAGVPLKSVVTGIAMGLVMDEDKGQYKILTDIQAQEDFNGDMDFKVAFSETGITALQLDIKIKGLKMDLIKEILEKAKKACDQIRTAITDVIPAPRAEMSQYAPIITSLSIDPSKIGAVIGPGGKMINDLIARHNVKIDITDDGLVSISSVGEAGGAAAMKEIEQLTYEPKVGDVFDGKVVRILDFGAIVEFGPKQDGMVHISQIAKERINSVEDVLKMGEVVRVKIVEIDKAANRTSLSIKAVGEDDKPRF